MTNRQGAETQRYMLIYYYYYYDFFLLLCNIIIIIAYHGFLHMRFHIEFTSVCARVCVVGRILNQA